MTLPELRQNSYVRYSHRPKIAVVRSDDGLYFPGVRIENISFPLTISAAQNALFCCISEGKIPQKLFSEEPEAGRKISYWGDLYDINDVEINALPQFQSAPVAFRDVDISSRLKELLAQACVPESDFPVAAILETADGYVAGVNIETPDWSRGLCAERVAIAKAVSYGFSGFRTLSIHTRGGEYSSPCGACRQVMAEHLSRQQVHLYHADGSRSEHFVSDLLPYSFQSSTLQSKSKD